MDIEEYIEAKRHAIRRIPSEIRERWNNRIVKNAWHLLGTVGAIEYLEQYGRGISITKVIGLAACAEAERYPEIALGFWQKAFELETQEKAPIKEVKTKPVKNSSPKIPNPVPPTTPEWKVRTFVPELRQIRLTQQTQQIAEQTQRQQKILDQLIGYSIFRNQGN